MKVPEQGVREYAHGLAYRLACEQLSGITDVEKQCRNSDAQYIPSLKVITMDHLNRSYQISFPDGEVSLIDGEETVPLRDKVLILHYFIRAKGTPLSNNNITYKELLEGINYYPTFFTRAINPIISHFGNEPHRLLDIAQQFGGHEVDYGDVAVTINAFSRVPITTVLWKGDDEFAPEGNIIFDSTISDYLPTEDITILCEALAWRLVRLLKTGGESPGSK
ncbi:DUF3786 domain-containing protein [Chloroflexota bacterium]